MAKPYTINIVNGEGQESIIRDTYNVTANVPGYDNSTITPTSITHDGTQTTYSFTIAATGELTIHVTEDGTSTGTPVVGATFIRTDATGTETYGSEVTTDATGNAILYNLPYDASNPINVYIKQTATAEEHTYDPEVITIVMNSATVTEEVENPGADLVTFILEDANYENVNIESGILTLN